MSEQQPAAAAPETPRTPVPPPPVAVNMRSVLTGLEAKLNKERELLLRHLNDPQLIRDFHGMTLLFDGLKSSIRSIDTLTGRTDILGNPIERPSTNVDPEPRRPSKIKKAKDSGGKRVSIKKPDNEATKAPD